MSRGGVQWGRTPSRGAGGVPGTWQSGARMLQTFWPKAWSSRKSPQVTPRPTSHVWLHHQYTGRHTEVPTHSGPQFPLCNMGQQSQHHFPGIIRSQYLWKVFVNHSMFTGMSTMAQLITMTNRATFWEIYMHIKLRIWKSVTKLSTVVLPDRQVPNHSDFLL